MIFINILFWGLGSVAIIAGLLFTSSMLYRFLDNDSLERFVKRHSRGPDPSNTDRLNGSFVYRHPTLFAGLLVLATFVGLVAFVGAFFQTAALMYGW